MNRYEHWLQLANGQIITHTDFSVYDECAYHVELQQKDIYVRYSLRETQKNYYEVSIQESG